MNAVVVVVVAPSAKIPVYTFKISFKAWKLNCPITSVPILQFDLAHEHNLKIKCYFKNLILQQSRNF